MDSRDARRAGFDRAAAVTRSLLGYGVVAGAFYLVVGIVLALTRDGFDLSRHSLSLLMLGDYGWMQRVNFILTGLMTLAAALGATRVLRSTPRFARAAILLAAFGGCLIASGIFAPDPMEGFPPGTVEEDVSFAGILHLAFGAVGFLCLAAAAFAMAGWYASRGEQTWSTYSRVSGAVVIVGFVGGAALATQTLGVISLWIAVVSAWLWLANTSIQLYRFAPHPDRNTPGEA